MTLLQLRNLVNEAIADLGPDTPIIVQHDVQNEDRFATLFELHDVTTEQIEDHLDGNSFLIKV